MTKQKHMITRLTKDVVSACPGRYILHCLLLVLDSSCSAIVPIVLERIFAHVLNLHTDHGLFASLYFWIIALLILKLAAEAFSGFSAYIVETNFELVKTSMWGRIASKSGRLSVIDFEKPEVLNNLEKARQGANAAWRAVGSILELITYYVPFLVIYGWYLYTCSAVLPVVFLFIFVPLLLSQLIKGKYQRELEDKSAKNRRKVDHYADCLGGKEFVKETRNLGAIGFFTNRYQQVMQLLRRDTIETNRKMLRVDVVTTLLDLLGYGSVIALLLYSVIHGHIEVAAFAAIFASVNTAYEHLEYIVCSEAGELSKNLALARNYDNFLALPEESRNLPEFSAKQQDVALTGITLQNIAFNYPDGTEALRDVSLSAKQGEIIGIVGANGSGKTTLAKILSGLYLPTAGQFKVDTNQAANAGLNTSIDQLSYWVRTKSTHLFQQYQKYSMTLGQNVTVSNKFGAYTATKYRLDNDAAVIPDDAEQTNTQIGVALGLAKFDLQTSAQQATADPCKQLLGREFGGTELSGGQWQRLALARTVYRDKDLIVLDEPTAAIDPAKESELYEAFQDSCQGKIGFIITHRLGLVKICHKILVMKAGEAVAFGPHQELLQTCPYYKEMWDAQARQYIH